MTSGSCRRIDRSRLAKVRPICDAHLDLVDALQLILDRVLDRDDLAGDRVQRQQPGVQRGGLAAAGRPGDQHDAVRQFQRRSQLADDRRRQAEAGVVEHDGGAIEDAQHHRLAMQRGDGGDAEIDVLAAHGHLDAPVLRHAPFGDIEPRHDLDARGDRGGEVTRRRFRLVQHAVVAVADAQPILERFDVDVGGLGFHRAGDQQVDQPDHRAPRWRGPSAVPRPLPAAHRRPASARRSASSG